jgi:hypothetical protein
VGMHRDVSELPRLMMTNAVGGCDGSLAFQLRVLCHARDFPECFPRSVAVLLHHFWHPCSRQPQSEKGNFIVEISVSFNLDFYGYFAML